MCLLDVPIHTSGVAATIPPAFDDQSTECSLAPASASVLCAPGLALNGVGHDIRVSFARRHYGCAGACNSFRGIECCCQWPRPPTLLSRLRCISPMHALIVRTFGLHHGGSCAASPFCVGVADTSVTGMYALQGRVCFTDRR